MRIRDFFLSRRSGLFIFITLLLLFALVLMSLRAKQRKGAGFFDALLMEICSPVRNYHLYQNRSGPCDMFW
jgi:hypothetical protein